MDRVIQKKTWTTKRIITISVIAGIVLLIAASYYFTSGGSKLDVDTDRLTVSTVTKGKFQENIPVNGIVLPQTTIYLDAIEGGRVEEKYVDDGTMMKKDQPILRLSNTDLELDLVNQKTNVYNLLTQMQISRNAAEQNTVEKLTQATDVESEFKEAQRIYNLDKDLYAKKAIGSQEYQKALNDYNYYSQKLKLTQKVLSQDSTSNKQQLTQAQQLYQGSQNALAVMQQKVGDLIVRSPVDGQLTSLDAEVGQSKNKGERLGQIDVMGGYKVRVDIDQHYISRIYAGLRGTFTFADSDYILEIKKVYTQVNANGSFQVDMAFVGKIPQGIRRGQTLQILLALSDVRTSILLPKGGFYQQTGGNWIFKVSADGTKAYKVDIQLGNVSTDYYEVLQGLQPGDKVITSSYENYGDIQQLVLKK
ncbi:MAG: HlyD family efflux transporter periplasmic adaptor subunit [Parafilimonas sp.]